MPNQVAVPWSRRSLFWGYVCGVSCLARSFSYFVLPPDPSSLTARSIEQVLNYTQWAWVLLVIGSGIMICTSFQNARITFALHGIAVFCFLTFAFSSVGGILDFVEADYPLHPDWKVIMSRSALQLVLKQGWAGIFPLIVVALVNGERCLNLGAIIRLEMAARDERRLQRKKKAA